ncbi:MAG: hypothetical protein ACHQ51_10385 [Elusimicrobiota bacterium]
MAPLALLAVVLAAATPARAQFDPACASWQGTTQPQPLSQCHPLPPEALEYAKQCLATFPDKVDTKYVVIGNYHGVSGDFARLYVLEWNKDDPSKSTILLRGGLGQGAGNGSVDGRVAGATVDHRDAWDSASSPGGCMRLFGTGDQGVMPTYPEYQGYKLEGLEQRNACVLTRGIHFHESDRVNTRRSEADPVSGTAAAAFNDVELDKNLAIGQSPGCFNVAVTDYAWIKKAGIVGRKGTLFLSYDGCRDKIERRGAPRRCKDAADVLDCRDRAPAPRIIPQMMIEQKKKNEKDMRRVMEFGDKIRRGLADP